ncbi:MAG: DUF3494 domain-containing protein [Myxococcales bacterium]|nr:DUF3494 domain-containing protein [Myxococcales bacterium]
MNRRLRLRHLASVFLLLIAAGCGDDGGSATGPDAGGPVPRVLSTVPLDGVGAVAINASISATFSEAMAPSALTGATFTLASDTAPIAGTVIYTDATAVFWPAAHLAIDSTFTATITTGAKSAQGVALAADYTWTFTTGSTVTAGLPVALATAGDFVMLAKSGIATVPTSAVTGDVGVSPIAASFITGFSLTADSSNTFSTSPQVTGRVYAADFAAPTPAKLTAAVGAMELAFTDAAGRAPDVTELGAGDIGGRTIAAGVYKWGTGLLIPTDVTLTGSATDVWIFQIAQDLTMSSGARIVLAGDAQAQNVFWQVAGLVELGTTAHCEGIVLSQTAINLRTGASINGRLLAQTAINIDGSTVTEPTP